MVLSVRRVPHPRVASEGLRRETGGRPRGADVIAIVTMQRLQPPVTRVRVPGLARVVFPRWLKHLERPVASRLPRYVGQQLRERAQSFFAAPQFLVVHVALDEVGREPRENVDEPQISC